MNKKYILLMLLFTILIGIYLIYLFFNNNQPSLTSLKRSVPSISKIYNIDNKKEYENPITGEISASEVRPEYLSRKPLAVMVNNAVPARPQAGLSQADIIYEIVAEGGITRFLAFYWSELPNKVGPIRSVREYYLPIVKEIGNSMLMHIGYSPQALQKIDEWGVLSLGLAGAEFYRDNRGNIDIATEHTAFANAKDLYTFGDALKYTNTENINSWKFNEEIDLTKFNEKANKIQIDFWYEGDYSAYFEFDPSTKEYIRYSGIVDLKPQILIDDLTKKEVRVKNVLIQFVNEVPIPGDDKGRLNYEMIGSGNSVLLRDGVVIKGRWSKDGINSRTKFMNLSGNEMEFDRGKIWVSVVPSRNENQVKYIQ